MWNSTELESDLFENCSCCINRIPLVRSRLERFPALYAGFLKSRLHLYNMYVIRSPLLRSAIPLSTFRFVMVIGL
ncbi:hypothetical protein T12_14273 [Trichinella patagoniensis]|uniref:Uncharacterized protein n=1 Tax=Trichinella patagoniensis TaxID=990121 RepID=A0A0V0ZCQ8_9BILA|nr:hypothetical protein T12_14273 [Trichinella patagoniensis]